MGITGKFGFKGNNGKKDNSPNTSIQSSIEQLLKSKKVEESVTKMGTAMTKAKEVAITTKDALAKKTEEQLKKVEDYANRVVENNVQQEVITVVAEEQSVQQPVQQVLAAEKTVNVETPMTDEEKFQKGIKLVNQRDFANGYSLIDEAARNGHSMSQNMMGLAYFEKHGAERSFFDAFYYFSKAAQQGNQFAMYNIAKMYLFGYGVVKNKEKALEWFEKAKEKGHETSICMTRLLKRELGDTTANPTIYDLFNYAMFYWHEEEYEMAIELAHQVINEGVTVAYCILGLASEKGFGMPKNYSKAIEYYRISAEGGYADSAYYLGEIYEFGRGVESNYEQARQWYQRAAQLGHSRAKRAVEIIYRKMNVTDKVSVQMGMNADYYYQKAVQYQQEGMYGEASLYALYATRQGHKIATYMRAKYCQDGLGIRPNMQEAIRLYKVAASTSIDAMIELGKIYEYGVGVDRNEEIAYEYYWKAQEWNHPEVYKSLHRLIKKNPNLYSKFMQEQDMVCKDRYLTKLSNAERMKALNPEEYMLICAIGTSFYYDEAMDKLIKSCTAYEIEQKQYKKAKENLEEYMQYGAGDVSICLKELNLLIKNEENKQDIEALDDEELLTLEEEAENDGYIYLSIWYGEILANRGNPIGQCLVGAAYLENIFGVEGVVQTDNGFVSYCDKRAFEWFSKAEMQQSEIAYYYLGQMYQEGKYVEKDLIKAKEYFEKAVEGEVEEASEALLTVKQQMQDLGIEDSSKTQVITQESSVKTLEDLPENIDKYFEGIIGLDTVKEQLNAIYQSVKIKLLRDKILRERGESVVDNGQGYNFVLLGNPGTGKTMMARIIAKILFDIGIRSSSEFIEVDRSKLLSDHIGGTEKKVRAILDKIDGGTLFIDEAHTLFREESDNDFGQEAIDTLLKEMEDQRGSFSVIIAGYKNPMRNMMKNANSGFASRFSYIIELPDYTDDELITIAHTLVEQKRYILEDGVDDAIKKCINHDKIDDTFGNARYIRELVEKAIRNLAVRVNSEENLSEDMLFILRPEDFWNGEPEEGAKEYLEELNSLIGLPSVKREVRTLINRITVQTEMEKRGLKGKSDFGTLHMAFKGNPGTGKTTVARIIGKLYASLGILKRKDIFVECSRATLIGQYQGSTAINVKKAVEAAMGGILFVDEAYSLVKGEGDTFGKEAVDTLVAEMENHRNSLIVIFAGYSQDIDAFFRNNQGLKSRVPIELYFEDYTKDELFEIACKMIQSNNYVLDNDAENKLKELLYHESFKPDFGNARGVRNIVESCIRNQNDRIADMLNNSGNAVGNEMFTLIQAEDILQIITR